MDLDRARLVGDYIVGPKIGSGSFAVVWRARHRKSGHEVAVKEIQKRQLSPKIRESLLKEISILSTIDHPNIIRFLEAIETEEKIYLVLEYCDGGDLAAYINRYGKVSEAVARHFMRQLAAGLQVLQEKHLIHRDLKPQNLLLSSNDPTPLMKIGDFGFARSLSQGLADTLCGSPLYMAPEIIQNKKYDAKADLWSVGAILFQLVTGRPPFNGNSQFQLFQNILTSTDLKFPGGALEELHPECVDLCRCLLRLNPVERLTFDEFFSHKFLQEPRPAILPMKSLVERSTSSAIPMNLFSVNAGGHEDNSEDFSSRRPLYGCIPTASKDVLRESVDDKPSSKQAQVSDISDSIEKDYVLVNAHLASIECISYVAEKSEINSKLEASAETLKKQNEQTGYAKDQVPGASTILRELQGLAILHPYTKLQLLHQYIQVLVELSQEKHNAGLYLESFSVELVILALWKKALQISSDWLASAAVNEKSAEISKSAHEGTSSSPRNKEDCDFSKPLCVHSWAEKSFLIAFGRAEKLEHHIRDMDGAANMPDAMEIIFQKALAFGTDGAVDEFVNRSTAAESYSKALLLLSFIEGEATTLPLNPPFSLTPDDKKRIHQYIVNLHSRQTNFLKSQPSHKPK